MFVPSLNTCFVFLNICSWGDSNLQLSPPAWVITETKHKWKKGWKKTKTHPYSDDVRMHHTSEIWAPEYLDSRNGDLRTKEMPSCETRGKGEFVERTRKEQKMSWTTNPCIAVQMKTTLNFCLDSTNFVIFNEIFQSTLIARWFPEDAGNTTYRVPFGVRAKRNGSAIPGRGERSAYFLATRSRLAQVPWQRSNPSLSLERSKILKPLKVCDSWKWCRGEVWTG